MIRTSKSSLSLPHSFVRGEKESFCLLGPLRGIPRGTFLEVRIILPSPYGVYLPFFAIFKPQISDYSSVPLRGVPQDQAEETLEALFILPSPYGVYLHLSYSSNNVSSLFFRPLTGCTATNAETAAKAAQFILPSPYGVYQHGGVCGYGSRCLFFRPLTGCTCTSIKHVRWMKRFILPSPYGVYLINSELVSAQNVYSSVPLRGVPKNCR